MCKITAWFPPELIHAHNFAFTLHDILVELLRSGEEHGIFNKTIDFNRSIDNGIAFEQAEDIFSWLAERQLLEERADILRIIVFPAILSDFLHFIFEALECSRKAKLNITYALLRKPLQEDLFILESIARDPIFFADQLASDPLKLRSSKVGGPDVHAKIIEELLKNINLDKRYDSRFLAQLRYEKCDDGFDSICNLAIHLITEHPKNKTEKMNLNFIFSDWDAKISQWTYLYSRLPYILAYARDLVEYVCTHIATTTDLYLEDLNLRVAASSLLWWRSIPERYKTKEIFKYVDIQKAFLQQYCLQNNTNFPTMRGLEYIAIHGTHQSWRKKIKSYILRSR